MGPPIGIDHPIPGAFGAAIDSEHPLEGQLPGGQTLLFVVGDIEVRINVLNVVVVFQGFGQP